MKTVKLWIVSLTCIFSFVFSVNPFQNAELVDQLAAKNYEAILKRICPMTRGGTRCYKDLPTGIEFRIQGLGKKFPFILKKKTAYSMLLEPKDQSYLLKVIYLEPGVLLPSKPRQEIDQITDFHLTQSAIEINLAFMAQLNQLSVFPLGLECCSDSDTPKPSGLTRFYLKFAPFPLQSLAEFLMDPQNEALVQTLKWKYDMMVQINVILIDIHSFNWAHNDFSSSTITMRDPRVPVITNFEKAFVSKNLDFNSKSRDKIGLGTIFEEILTIEAKRKYLKQLGPCTDRQFCGKLKKQFPDQDDLKGSRVYCNADIQRIIQYLKTGGMPTDIHISNVHSALTNNFRGPLFELKANELMV